MKKLTSSLTNLKDLLHRFVTFFAHHEQKKLPSQALHKKQNQSQSLNNGELWSLLKMEHTSLGIWWKGLYPEVTKRFPKLRFVHPEELHLTMMIVGSWNVTDLPKLQQLSLKIPKERIVTDLHLSLMGPFQQWLALELDQVPNDWKQAVVDAKKEIVRLGLIKPSPYDNEFRAHVSIATPWSTPEPPIASSTPLTKEEKKALRDFQKFLKTKSCPPSLMLSPKELSECSSFWLTSATRPPDYHTYIPLNDWLKFYMPEGVSLTF